MSSAQAGMLEGAPLMTDADMQQIVRLVYAHSGIALRADTKRAMVSARLQKRVRQGGFLTFAEYLRYVQREPTGRELTALLDAITTNHTSFYREPAHFEFLTSTVLQPWIGSGPRNLRPINGWCAACATGEEAYTIAVTLLEHVPFADRGRLRLLASDLSTRALEAARAGVYPLDRVAQVPQQTLRSYFERGRDEQFGLARVKRSVRDLIQFRHLNLLEIDSLGQMFDFIFCRNVMIYFDTVARDRVVTMLERHLVPRGYLFVSHSESLNTGGHKLQLCAPGVYRRGDA